MKTNISSEMDNVNGKQSLLCNAIKIWCTRSAKLAVAVAIIKSKPPGKSGRQYAEQLAARFSHLERSWKTKAEDLQEEVMKLRRELFLSKMLSKPRRNSGNDIGLMEVLSQDPIQSSGPWLSGSEQLCTEPDSGCGTENDTESLQHGKGQMESFTPFPIQPRQPRFPQPGTDPRENALLASMRFLQNLCGLRKLDAHGLALDGHGSVVWDSVCQMLGSLVSAFRGDPRHLQQDLLLQASEVAAQAVDVWRVHCKPPEPFLTQAEVYLENLTDHLLNNSQLNRLLSQECLTACLIRFGGSATLRPALLRLLLSHINHVADQLWESCQETSNPRTEIFKVDHYENSFYLFWILEQVVRERGVSELREAQDQLERHLVHLADEYPLFSLYLWRIVALLKPDVSSAVTSNTAD